MLTVWELSIRRGAKPLFAPVSFHLQAGEGIWLQGDNGSGKTSLLQCIAGIQALASGSITWDETPVADMGLAFNGLMHYVGHDALMHPQLSLLDNVYLDLRTAFVSEKECLRTIRDWGLTMDPHQLVANLSAGQKQRLALARLSLSRAKLWLLDEPFVALDRASQERLTVACQSHLNDGGLLVMTSHQERPGLSSHVGTYRLIREGEDD